MKRKNTSLDEIVWLTTTFTAEKGSVQEVRAQLGDLGGMLELALDAGVPALVREESPNHFSLWVAFRSQEQIRDLQNGLKNSELEDDIQILPAPKANEMLLRDAKALFVADCSRLAESISAYLEPDMHDASSAPLDVLQAMREEAAQRWEQVRCRREERAKVRRGHERRPEPAGPGSQNQP